MLPEKFIIKVKNYLDEVGINIDTLTIRDLDDNYSDIDYTGLLCCNNIFRFNYGATRGCIIPIENDCSQPKFVFKFDFDELSESYCFNEAEIYHRAERAGLAPCFAEVKYFDNISSLTRVYICEFVDVTHVKTNAYITNEELKQIADHTSRHNKAPHIPYVWSRDFIEYYGDAVYDDFLNFLVENGINDLHSSNLGYKDGRPIVFDYAGYFEPSSDYSCNF